MLNVTSIILIVNKGINLGMGNYLLSTNQVRDYGLHIDNNLFFQAFDIPLLRI